MNVKRIESLTSLQVSPFFAPVFIAQRARFKGVEAVTKKNRHRVRHLPFPNVGHVGCGRNATFRSGRPAALRCPRSLSVPGWQRPRSWAAVANVPLLESEPHGRRGVGRGLSGALAC